MHIHCTENLQRILYNDIFPIVIVSDFGLQTSNKVG